MNKRWRLPNQRKFLKPGIESFNRVGDIVLRSEEGKNISLRYIDENGGDGEILTAARLAVVSNLVKHHIFQREWKNKKQSSKEDILELQRFLTFGGWSDPHDSIISGTNARFFYAMASLVQLYHEHTGDNRALLDVPYTSKSIAPKIHDLVVEAVGGDKSSEKDLKENYGIGWKGNPAQWKKIADGDFSKLLDLFLFQMLGGEV